MSRDTLWTDRTASRATGGRATAPFEADGVAFDSREVRDSDLFVALAGTTTDGHRHVGQAFEKGAAAAMVSREPEDAPPPASPLLLVIDTSRGLGDLAREARRRTGARIAAVTGSVGKTGAKEMLRAVLARQGPTHASEKSYNNHVGTPLSLARMPAATRYGIFEVGTNAPGEVRPLSRMVRPHVALVTTVEPVHVGNFAGESALVEEKAAIFEGLEAGGVAVINADNRHAGALARHAGRCGARVVPFGSCAEAAFRLVDWSPTAAGSRVRMAAAGSVHDYTLGLHGRHLALNSVAVLAVVDALGGDIGEAAAAMADLEPPAGRGVRHAVALPGGIALVIDESYNASPVAVRAALEVLAATPTGPGGRRVAVLGDMAELGPAGPEAHAGLADAVHGSVDRLFTVGPLMNHLVDRLPLGCRGGSAHDAAAMADLLAGQLGPGDVVLVKGSRRVGLEAVVGAFTAGRAGR